MMLHVAEVVEVQLAARELAPRDGAGRLERFGGFRGQRLEHLPAADCDIFEGFLPAQAWAGSRLALVSAAQVKLAQLEGRLVAGREIEVEPEERVIRHPAKRAVGDLPFPVLGRTGADALVQHAQRRLELAGENRFDVLGHGIRYPGESGATDHAKSPTRGQARLPGPGSIAAAALRCR